jgi:hypothetical protein
MGTNSAIKKKHYTALLVASSRVVGYVDGKKIGTGGKPVPHPNDKAPERLDWSKIK